MSIEGKLDYWLSGLWIQWKGMVRLKYLPFIVNYIIIPVSLYIYWRMHVEYFTDHIKEQVFFFVPIMSVWWEILLLQQYVEGDGRELLWINNQNKLFDIIVYFILYIISLFPILKFVMEIMEDGYEVIPLLLAQCFMYTGVVYMFCLIFSSVAMAFIPIFVYTLFADNRISLMLSYNAVGSFQTPMYYMEAGIIFIILGLIYKRYHKKMI